MFALLFAMFAAPDTSLTLELLLSIAKSFARLAEEFRRSMTWDRLRSRKCFSDLDWLSPMTQVVSVIPTNPARIGEW